MSVLKDKLLITIVAAIALILISIVMINSIQHMPGNTSNVTVINGSSADGNDVSIVNGSNVSKPIGHDQLSEFILENQRRVASLPFWQKKLDSSLLVLVNSSMAPRGTTQNDTINVLKGMGAYYSKDDYNKLFNVNVATDGVVFVQIGLKPSASNDVVNPYVLSIVKSYDEYHYVEAYVEVKDLEKIASLDDVDFIYRLLRPITNANSTNNDPSTINSNSSIVNDLNTSQSSGNNKLNIFILDNTNRIAGLPLWQKKLDYNLIVLVNSSFASPGMTQNDTINMLKSVGIYYSKDDYNKNFGSDKATDDVVSVHISFKSTASRDIVTPYVLDMAKFVDPKDESRYHWADAHVEVKKLEKIASLDDVTGIGVNWPPISNS